jgi:hypothetical protein
MTRSFVATLACLLLACSSDHPTGPIDVTPRSLPVTGLGAVDDRWTAELWVEGNTAYTTTWGLRGTSFGNALFVWDVSGDVPALVDSVIVSGATTLGDVQASDDGSILIVATERANGSLVVFSLANPRKPVEIARLHTPSTDPGVHTATLARVDGRLYAFLCIDPPQRLVVVDLGVPSAPVQVLDRPMGRPFVHDVFVRDGLLFTALWADGITIWDIDGGGAGGTPANPIALGSVQTESSTGSSAASAHNIWWFHDPSNGARRYAFVGEEGPGGIAGNSASGDLHVVDVSDLANPVEVAFYHVPDAGAHNFYMDEARGLLYAAFYNGGVRVLDVRGDLGDCATEQRSFDGRCDLGAMDRELGTALTGGEPVFVWGVHVQGDFLYASDMLNGLWKVRRFAR